MEWLKEKIKKEASQIQSAGSKYKAVLFSFNGEWVTDFVGATIDDVEKQLGDRGSRWYFYPIDGIIEMDDDTVSDGSKVVKMYGEFIDLKGKTVLDVSKYIKEWATEQQKASKAEIERTAKMFPQYKNYDLSKGFWEVSKDDKSIIEKEPLKEKVERIMSGKPKYSRSATMFADIDDQNVETVRIIDWDSKTNLYTVQTEKGRQYIVKESQLKPKIKIF